MDDLTFNSDDVRVSKLIADVQHKFNTFSISNTLFPKNEINHFDLDNFFRKVSKDVYMILNAPVGTIPKIVDNQLTFESYSVVTMSAKNLNELADNLNKFIKPCEVMAFYDLTYDVSLCRYNIRIKVFENDLRLKAYKRDQKIDELLDDK